MKRRVTAEIVITAVCFIVALVVLLAVLFGCATPPLRTPLSKWEAAVQAALPPLPTTSAPLVATSNPTVKLAWDPSPDPSVVGYVVYWGVAHWTYTNSLSVGSNLQATITNLTLNTSYYFACTSDAGGIQSDYSNEVVGRIVPPTNVVTFYVTILASDTVTGSYTNIKTLDAYSVTNPVGVNYTKALVSVTTTNVAQ